MPSIRPGIRLTIERSQCVGCAICADACPCSALAMGPEDSQPAWQPELCNACGDCARECPTAAIILEPEMVAANS